jgi:type 2 lantibiotic biosynthesis protein LanM
MWQGSGVQGGLTESQWQQLLAVLASAATLHERASGKFFSVLPRQDPEVIRDRLSRWIEAVAEGDYARFVIYLRTTGLAESEVTNAVSNVSVRDPKRLPGWAQGLVAFLCGQATDDRAEVGEEIVLPMRRLYRVFQHTGINSLAPLVQRLPVPLTPQAKAEFGDQLANRLLIIGGQALDFELHIDSITSAVFGEHNAPRPALGISLGRWIERFERLPGLAYVIGATYEQWLASNVEMADRLRRDWRSLCERFWQGNTPHLLTGFQGDAGDPHQGGRSVCVLTFDGTKRVVYKPKDLRIGAGFMEVLRFLNRADLPLSLPVRTILSQDGYGWEEHVERLPCQSEQEINDFYFRMGLIIRLLQLVEARDFWLDNLVASAGHPVFVDLETVLSPRKRRRPIPEAERRVWDVLDESMALTGAVALPTPIRRGLPAEDFGALTPARDLRTPYRISLPQLERAGWSSSLDEEGYVCLNSERHVPMLDGQPASPDSHLERVSAGYHTMDDCLRRNRDGLSARGGPLRRLAGLPVRYIRQDTWSYHLIIQHTLSPLALTDGIEREISLARILRSAHIGSASEETAIRIDANEMGALRRLDVPLLLAKSDNSSLYLEDGTEVRDYFEGSPYERMLARLEAPPVIHDQLDLLCSSLEEGMHAGTMTIPSRGLALRAAYADKGGSLIEHAIEIGDFAISHSEKGSDGSISWLGLVYDPFHDMKTLGPLRQDLLTGTCGLAVLFADLFAASGCTRFEVAARKVLDAIGQTLADARLSGSELGGGFLGIGSQIYALRRCAATLGDSALGHLAASVAAKLPVRQLAQDVSFDIVSGIAGLLLAVTALPMAGYELPAGVVGTLTRQLLAASRSLSGISSPPFPRGSTYLPHLPGTFASVDLALARAIGPVFWSSYEPMGHVPQPSEASVGCMLAALSGSTAVDEGLLAKVEELLNRDFDEMTSLALLDSMEVALAAHQATGLTPFRARARRLAQHLVGRHESSGRWFPDRLSADRHNLSIVCGVAAIAHAILKLEDPLTFPSVRVLA